MRTRRELCFVRFLVVSWCCRFNLLIAQRAGCVNLAPLPVPVVSIVGALGTPNVNVNSAVRAHPSDNMVACQWLRAGQSAGHGHSLFLDTHGPQTPQSIGIHPWGLLESITPFLGLRHGRVLSLPVSVSESTWTGPPASPLPGLVRNQPGCSSTSPSVAARCRQRVMFIRNNRSRVVLPTPSTISRSCFSAARICDSLHSGT